MIVKHFCMNIIVCPDQYINPVMISYMPRVTHVVNVCGLTWFNKHPDIIIWQIQLAYSYHFVRYFYRKRSSIKFSLGQLLTPTSTLGRSRLLDSFAVSSRLPVQERKMILGTWYSSSQEGWESRRTQHYLDILRSPRQQVSGMTISARAKTKAKPKESAQA